MSHQLKNFRSRNYTGSVKHTIQKYHVNNDYNLFKTTRGIIMIPLVVLGAMTKYVEPTL